MIEPIQVIVQILQIEFELAEGRVMVANQEFVPPKDGLYIVLSYLPGSTVTGNKNKCYPTDQGMLEVQSLSMRHVIQIELMSFDDSARERKEELLMALRSVTSQRLQGLHQIGIARNPGPILDLSSIEGSGRMQRFHVDVAVAATHRKEKQVPYFDSFKVAVNPSANSTPEVQVNA